MCSTQKLVEIATVLCLGLGVTRKFSLFKRFQPEIKIFELLLLRLVSNSLIFLAPFHGKKGSHYAYQGAFNKIPGSTEKYSAYYQWVGLFLFLQVCKRDPCSLKYGRPEVLIRMALSKLSSLTLDGEEKSVEPSRIICWK